MCHRAWRVMMNTYDAIHPMPPCCSPLPTTDSYHGHIVPMLCPSCSHLMPIHLCPCPYTHALYDGVYLDVDFMFMMVCHLGWTSEWTQAYKIWDLTLLHWTCGYCHTANTLIHQDTMSASGLMCVQIHWLSHGSVGVLPLVPSHTSSIQS